MPDRYSQEPYPTPIDPVRVGPIQATTMAVVMRLWFPLAVSWILMTAGTPVINAGIARMADAKLHLAAFGIAVSLAWAVQSPVTPLLTATVALAKDRASLQLLGRFMLALVAVTTLCTAALSYRPLFDLVVLKLMGTPVAVAELARPALWVFIPFPAAVAYRRFRQGMVIQDGATSQVTYGALVRLLTMTGLALIGLMWGKVPGATWGAIALMSGIVCEAIYTHFVSRRAVRLVVTKGAQNRAQPLTLTFLVRFFWPLALTGIVWLLAPSLVNFGITRSPDPIESLAVWPVVSGQVSMFCSFGFGFLEVVVAVLSAPGAVDSVRRSAITLCVVSSALLAMVSFTPLAADWQRVIAGLSPELTAFAVPALRYALLLPAIAVAQSWLRGLIVGSESTSIIGQATVINVAVLVIVLMIGAALGRLSGAIMGSIALTVSRLVEIGWLWRRALKAQRCMLEGAKAGGACVRG